ncbi:MAG: hypothetical protein ACXU9U_05790 [Parachlamydiaceae bacterium]
MATKGRFYFSRLVNGVRQDFCLSCWNDDNKSLKESVSNCQWKAELPSKKEIPSIPQTKQENALALLKSLLSSPVEETLVETRILALYLVRKRLLTFRRDFDEEGVRYSLFEVNATEEMLIVRKVSLEKANLPELQQTIATKLKI